MLQLAAPGSRFGFVPPPGPTTQRQSPAIQSSASQPEQERNLAAQLQNTSTLTKFNNVHHIQEPQQPRVSSRFIPGEPFQYRESFVLVTNILQLPLILLPPYQVNHIPLDVLMPLSDIRITTARPVLAPASNIQLANRFHFSNPEDMDFQLDDYARSDTNEIQRDIDDYSDSDVERAARDTNRNASTIITGNNPFIEACYYLPQSEGARIENGNVNNFAGTTTNPGESNNDGNLTSIATMMITNNCQPLNSTRLPHQKMK